MENNNTQNTPEFISDTDVSNSGGSAPIKNLPSTDTSKLPGFISDEQSSQIDASQSSDVTTDNGKGWFQDTVDSIAEPFLKVSSTFSSGAGVLLADIFGGNEAGEKVRENATKNGVDYGWLGKVKPIGADAYQAYKNNQIDATTAVLRGGEDLIGTGAQIASYFVGTGEETAAMKAGENILGDSANIAKKTIWDTAMKTMTNAVPFSALQALGTGLEAGGQGKEHPVAAGVENFVGNIVGYSLFSGAFGLLRFGAVKLISNPIVAAANKYLVDVISKTLGATPEEMVDKIFNKQLTNEVAQGKKMLIQGVGDALKTPDSPGSLLQTIKGKTDNYVTAAFEQKKNLFGELIKANPAATPSDFPEFSKVLSEANNFLDRNYGETASGGRIGTNPVTGKANFLALTSESERVDSPLQQFIDEIKKYIGEDGTTPLTYNDLEKLSLAKEKYSGNSAETSLINQLYGTLRKDFKISLLNHPVPGISNLGKIWEKNLEQPLK